MVDYLARPPIHEAFFKKYASKKFLKGMLDSQMLMVSGSPVADAFGSFYPFPPMGQEERAAVWHRRCPSFFGRDFMIMTKLAVTRIVLLPVGCLELYESRSSVWHTTISRWTLS